MAPTTNNKPCAQHTETSGGRSGHLSRTVTVIERETVHTDDNQHTHKLT